MKIEKKIIAKFNDIDRSMLTTFYENFSGIQDACFGEYTDCNHCPFQDLCRIRENSNDVDDFINSLEEEMSVVFDND